METSFAPPYRLAWSRTPEGVVVLRYYEGAAEDRDQRQAVPSWVGGGSREPDAPILRLMLDLRAVPGDAPGNAMLRFVQGLPDFVRRLPQRRAYLYADEAQRGMAGMIQAHSEPLQFEAGYFTSWNEALDWVRHRG